MSNSNTEQKEIDILFPEGKKIEIAGKEFVIKPFVLRNRIKVIKLFSSIFLEAAKNPGFRNLTDVAAIISIIEVAGESLTDIYISVTGAEREWLEENVQMKDEISLIQAIVEVNNIPLLISQIQGIIQKAK